jgi:rsbT co-antagonist protein RsbR
VANSGPGPGDGQQVWGDHAALLPELVSHLQTNRTSLRKAWAQRITDARLLSAMTAQKVFTEVTSVYDNYVAVLETGSVEELRRYARDLSERIIPRGVETDEVVGIVLLLRDVLARSLFEKYRDDFDLLNRVLDAYEPAANRIANTVAVSFVEQRERVIRQQQDSIRELSTPSSKSANDSSSRPSSASSTAHAPNNSPALTPRLSDRCSDPFNTTLERRCRP